MSPEYIIQVVKQIKSFCGIRYLPLKVKFIWYFQFLIGYFVKFILGNTTLSLLFLYNTNYFNGVSIIS